MVDFPASYVRLPEGVSKTLCQAYNCWEASGFLDDVSKPQTFTKKLHRVHQTSLSKAAPLTKTHRCAKIKDMHHRSLTAHLIHLPLKKWWLAGRRYFSYGVSVTFQGLC